MMWYVVGVCKINEFSVEQLKKNIEKNTYFFNKINITCNTLAGHRLVSLHTKTIPFCDPPHQDC
jgi:hypothetical protein